MGEASNLRAFYMKYLAHVLHVKPDLLLFKSAKTDTD